MSYQECIPVVAGADLNTDDHQYHVVAVAGTIAPSPVTAGGLLQNKPKSGEDASLCYAGRSRFRAGGAVTAGARLTSTASGWVTAVVSGGASEMIGTALGAVSSGGIGEGIFNFATPTNY